jgi:hypothetical protein
LTLSCDPYTHKPPKGDDLGDDEGGDDTDPGAGGVPGGGGGMDDYGGGGGGGGDDYDGDDYGGGGGGGGGGDGPSPADPIKGFVQLDDLTFDKVIDGSRNVFVYAYTAYDDVSTVNALELAS